MKKRRTAFAALLGFSLAASVYGHGEGNHSEEGRFDDLGVFSDSGIEGPKFSEIEAELKSLEKAFPKMAKVFVYGKSIKGLNLTGIKIEQEGHFEENRPAVLLTGATHGNEFLHIEDRMPRYVLEHWTTLPNMKQFFEKGGVFYIVPVFNPDGYVRDVRGNSAGSDLNRDFDLKPTGLKGFTQPETASFLKFLEKEVSDQKLSLKLTMDYHCCANAWLYPWSYKDEPLGKADLDAHQDVAQMGNDIFGKDYEHGTTPTVLGYYAAGTSKDFYFIRFGSLSYTFEGAYETEVKNMDLHTKYWDAILGRF